MKIRFINKYNLLLLLLSFLPILTGCNTQKEPAGATVEETFSATSGSAGYSELTTSLPEGVAYIMDDGTPVLINDLLSPAQIYNNICTTGKSDYFDLVYPQEILDYVLLTYNAENAETYALLMYDLYCQIYNESFSMSNEYISCELLTLSQLEDFSAYYLEHTGVTLMPEYGFIVESEYQITYTDENGEEQSDRETDYYIAYYLNGTFYLDYFYIDNLDL